MRSFLREFKEFISAGNLIELAVAFILGLAVKAVIDAFIENVMNPIVGAIVGRPNLDDSLTWTVREGTSDQADIRFGTVLTELLTLVMVGLVLFLVLKAYNRLRRAPTAAAAGPSDNELLTEIRDLLRTRA